MTLPIQMPFPPMEAKQLRKLPEGPEWQYEPKWDGFRCIVFREGDTVELQSKACKPLTRYFPEVVAALLELKAKQFVLDGELVVPDGAHLNFDALLQRIHPAASRVKKLSEQTPARYVVFDLLVDEKDRALHEQPLEQRRQALEAFAAKFFDGGDVVLTPATRTLKDSARWKKQAGSALDGLIAKRLDAAYEPGEREGMVKVKYLKTADCVVGGFRYGSKERVVGSLLLGLYDQAGLLNHIGFTSSMPREDRAALTKKLEALREPPGFTGNAPGGPSRWSTERSTQWEPLRPELVVEVQYDHLSNGRFRHGTKFLRWRPDKAPRQCTVEQFTPEEQGAMRLLGG